MTEKCEPPPEVKPETWLGEFAAAAQKAGWEVEISLGNVAPPASVSSATVAALVEALEGLVMACELPGDHCEVEQALPAARAALALYRGGRGDE